MRICGFLLALLMPCALWGQEQQKDSTAQAARDTTVLSGDSIRMGKRYVDIETYAKRFDPRKALFFSAVLPGLGQAYNKKYWKIPLVYGGLLGLITVVKYYNDSELKYRSQLFYGINNPNQQLYPGYTYSQLTPQLRGIVDQARRQRDYFTIMTGIFYILQMVDAHVDAHLKEFDLNPKLHVRLEPCLMPGSVVGMGLTVHF